MDQIFKPVLNSPIGPLPVNCLLGSVVPSLLSLIRLMTEIHLILMSLRVPDTYGVFSASFYKHLWLDLFFCTQILL